MIKLNFKSNKFKISILAALTFTSINSFAENDKLLTEKLSLKFSEKKYNMNKISEKSKDKFSISLTLNNNIYILELENNSKLNKRKKHSKNSFSLLKGKIKNIENSWVRLTEEDGLYTGLIFDGTDTFVIDTVEQFNKATHKISNKNNKLIREKNNKQIIAMNLEDIQHNGSCASHSEDGFHNMYSIDNMSIDQNLLEENLTESRSIVIDITGDKEFANNNEATAEQNILSYINTVNGIFESTLNVTFEIGEIKFLDDSNNITSTDSLYILTNEGVKVGNAGGNYNLLDGANWGTIPFSKEVEKFQQKLNQEFASKETSPLHEDDLENFKSLDFLLESTCLGFPFTSNKPDGP